MLDRTKSLLACAIDTGNPREELTEILHATIELLSLPDNDFCWSSWASQEEAIAEVRSVLAEMEAGLFPQRLDVAVLFAPTGPLQEVSLSSGWGQMFLVLAERFDSVEALLWR